MSERRFYLCKWPAPHHEITLAYASGKPEIKSVFAEKLHKRGLQFSELIIEQFPLPPRPLVLEFKLNTPDRIDPATASKSQLYQQLQKCELVLPLAASEGQPTVAPAVSLSLQSGDEHDQYGEPSFAQPGWAFQTAVTRLLLPNLYDAMVNLQRVEQGSGEGDQSSAERRVYDEIAMFIPGPAQADPGAATTNSNGGSGPRPSGRGTRGGPQQPVAARQTPSTPAATRGSSAPGNTGPTAPRTGPAAAATPNSERADLDTIKINLDSGLLASVSSSGSVPTRASATSSRASSSASKPSTAGSKVSANSAGPAHHDELAELAASAAMPLPDDSDNESGSEVSSGRSKQKTLARAKKGAESPAEASGASPASSGGMMTRSRSRAAGGKQT